jgi:hypothetical protein
MRFPGSVFIGLIFCCFFHFSKTVYSQDTLTGKEPPYFVVSGGIYSVLDLWATTGFVNFQFQPGVKWWVLRPQLGALVSFSGSCMIYAGLTYPARPVKWLDIQTGAALGYYESGNGINMGLPLEFRLSLSVLYIFRNFTQLGMEISHISNANLSTHNPGTEAVSVIIQIPLRKRKAY